MTLRPLLVAALLFLGPLQSLDDAARDAVLAGRRPALERPMRLLTEAGKPALFVTGAGLLVAGAAARALLVEAAVVLGPVNLVVEGVKWVTWRARPDGTHRRRNAAFPSSHAANAFAVAVLLGRRWPRAGVPLLALAAAVAYSRMYLDRHWLTDVVAGAALGASMAWWLAGAWAAWRRTAAGAAA